MPGLQLIIRMRYRKLNPSGRKFWAQETVKLCETVFPNVNISNIEESLKRKAEAWIESRRLEHPKAIFESI